MEVGQNIKDEFIDKFKNSYPEISKVIDFEINRYGNIISDVKIYSHFILNEITFYKNKNSTVEDFQEALSIFCIAETLGNKGAINMETLDNRVFYIGDGDDVLAVKFEKINNNQIAKIWFRWWED